jgi:hypothetical protein
MFSSRYITRSREQLDFTYDPKTRDATVTHSDLPGQVFRITRDETGLDWPDFNMPSQESAWLLGCWATVTMIYGVDHA